MDNKDRINLKKMMKEYDVVDQTQNIRNLKHSSLIKADVSIIKDLHKQFPNKSKDFLETKYFEKSNFLFKNYTEIYNKLIKKELNTNILNKILNCLEKIENGNCDQQEASFEVGSLLKQLYIDSALQNAKKLESNENIEKETIKVEPKNISWAEYKIKLKNNL